MRTETSSFRDENSHLYEKYSLREPSRPSENLIPQETKISPARALSFLIFRPGRLHVHSELPLRDIVFITVLATRIGSSRNGSFRPKAVIIAARKLTGTEMSSSRENFLFGKKIFMKTCSLSLNNQSIKRSQTKVVFRWFECSDDFHHLASFVF